MFKIHSSKFKVQELKSILLPILFFMVTLSTIAQQTAEDIFVLDKIETPSFIVSFEYNEQGKVTSEAKDGKGNDYLYYKFEYEYDNNGNITHLTEQGPYIIHQEENEYNSDNQITVKYVYEDYGSGFKYVEQHLYTYENMLLQTILKQMISPSGPVNSTKQEFVYNKEQQLMQITKHDWVMGDWIHTETYDLEYNESGNLLYYANSLLEWEGSFAKTNRYAFHYNDCGELTERSHHNALGSDWNHRPDRQYFYFYETQTKDETILYPNIYQFDNLNFNWFQSGKKLVLDSLWVSDCSGNINFIESANYHYKIITFNNEIDEYEETANILAYPNPTTGVLNIIQERITNCEFRIKDVEVFDVYGRMQKAESRKGEKEKGEITIDITNLPTGIYFIKIVTDENIITKKILKY